MSNIVHFRPSGRHRRVMRERACFWVVRLSAGASEGDLREIHAWLAEHPGHVNALLDAAAMWDRASVLSELSEIFPLESCLRSRRPPLPSIAIIVLLGFVLLAAARPPLLDPDDAAWRSAALSGVPVIRETRFGEFSSVTLRDSPEAPSCRSVSIMQAKTTNTRKRGETT